MTFLPMVERELRVAARRKSTYRLRTWSVVVALVVGSFSFFPILLIPGPGAIGKPLYTNLTGIVFGLCLLAGALLTADCLSEEKREGTLGLLFLTDLKGYDVVLGKFMAMSLNAIYGLLAILPITGLSLLLGGIGGGEFWRMTLALLNTLFFSLTTGTLVSALGLDSQRVMGATLVLVILCAVGLPALVKTALAMGAPPRWDCLAWLSPYYAFGEAMEPAYSWHPAKYWWALLTSQLYGGILLALASRALPNRWQERSGEGDRTGVLTQWSQRRNRGLAERARAREELLPVNPVFWLMSCGPDLRTIAWVIVWAWAGIVLLSTLSSPRETTAFVLGWYGVRPFGFLLKLLLALQACRFFVEARRNGALEMLLCTSLTSREILDGQILALKRSFLPPVIWMLILLFIPAVVQVFGTRAWNSSDTGTAFIGLVVSGFYCLRMYADSYAVIWFGMWLALTLRKPGLAPSLTVLFVLVLPSVLCVLDIFADIFFITWGMTKLRHQDLRRLAARQFETRAGPEPGKELVPAQRARMG